MDRSTKHGKLKIFIGMVAGVGKTCAMLQSASQLKADGVDVVVGYLETHGRKKTQEFSKGLEVIPRKNIEYRGACLSEMDLDAILKRNPQLVLVDELAHSNAPTSRHEKRFQDIIELLEAGIDVFTTINIQHFESRVHIVEGLSQIKVHETVPDSILELASDIELIDLSPEELLQRLERGDIYPQEKVKDSLKGFFKRGTLTALREMALRLSAEKVDQDVQRAIKRHELPQSTKNRDRLMVAIGPSPSAMELLRWTRNKAYNLEANWIAVYVDTGQSLCAEDHKLLDENLELARHLGAEVVTTSGSSVTEALYNLARERYVTEIVLGKPSLSPLHKFLAPSSPAEELLKRQGEFTVSIVTTKKGKKPTLWQLLNAKIHSQPGEYLWALFFLGLATLFHLLLLPLLGYKAVGLGYLFMIVVQSLLTGRGPIIFSAIASLIMWNFIFMPPRYTFVLAENEDLFVLFLYGFVALVLGTFTTRLRNNERAYKRSEEQAWLVYTLSRAFSEEHEIQSVVERVHAILFNKWKAQVLLFLANDPSSNTEGNTGTLVASTLKALAPVGVDIPNVKERGVAHWCYKNKRRAGRNTETLNEAEGIYYPITNAAQQYGTLAVLIPRSEKINTSRKHILEMLSAQFGVLLSRLQTEREITHTRSLEASSKLQKSLLSSVSHELKTPLTSIKGHAQALLEAASKPKLDHKQIELFSEEILTSCERLDHVFEQLLDMSRLEGGHLKASLESVDLMDIGGILKRALSEDDLKRVRVQSLMNAPLVRADFGLLSDVLRNLVSNALKHNPVQTSVDVTWEPSGNRVDVLVEDNGDGMPVEDGQDYTKKFVRGKHSAAGGLGLGLSIVRGFCEVMGAEFLIQSRRDGKRGTCARIRLDKAEAIL